MVESNSKNQVSHKVKSPFKAYNGDDEPYIFVSYKHKDADIVYPIIKQFHDLGFNIWYDEGLPYGENFDIVIPNKIEGATIFVNFITHECMACANDSEDYMIKESDIAQYLGVPILAIYPQPDVKLKGYYLTNYLKKQSVHKHEYDFNEEMFIDVCVEIFESKGLNHNTVEESEPAIEETPDDYLKTEVKEIEPKMEESPDDSLKFEFPVPAFDYRKDEPYIFVTYSHRDSAKIFPEIKRFNDMGYNIWYDQGISPGNEWLEEIEYALLKSSLFVVFISKNAVESQNVINEIHLAFSENKPIIPIYLEETELKSGLRYLLSNTQSIFKYEMSENEYLYTCTKAFKKAGIPQIEFEYTPNNNDADINYDDLPLSYGGDEKHIFISFKHKERDLAFSLIKQFHDNGFDKIAYDNLLSLGGEYDINIAERIKSSSLFVIFITKAVMEGANNPEDFMIKELSVAMSLGIPILPVFLEDVELDGFYLIHLLNRHAILKFEYENEQIFINDCIRIFDKDYGIK